MNPKFYPIGSLVRVITVGTPVRTLHLVTGLLLTGKGLEYVLDGGDKSVLHIDLEWSGPPTDLLIRKALKKQQESFSTYHQSRIQSNSLEAS